MTLTVEQKRDLATALFLLRAVRGRFGKAAVNTQEVFQIEAVNEVCDRLARSVGVSAEFYKLLVLEPIVDIKVETTESCKTEIVSAIFGKLPPPAKKNHWKRERKPKAG